MRKHKDVFVTAISIIDDLQVLVFHLDENFLDSVHKPFATLVCAIIGHNIVLQDVPTRRYFRKRCV